VPPGWTEIYRIAGLRCRRTLFVPMQVDELRQLVCGAGVTASSS